MWVRERRELWLRNTVENGIGFQVHLCDITFVTTYSVSARLLVHKCLRTSCSCLASHVPEARKLCDPLDTVMFSVNPLSFLSITELLHNGLWDDNHHAGFASSCCLAFSSMSSLSTCRRGERFCGAALSATLKKKSLVGQNNNYTTTKEKNRWMNACWPTFTS